MAIQGKSERSRIEVVFNDGEFELDVWFTPNNPRNAEYIENIRKAAGSYYMRSGNISDLARASAKICENFDAMTEPGTAERIFRYDTTENYETFFSIVAEMGRIMEQYNKDRKQALDGAKRESADYRAEE